MHISRGPAKLAFLVCFSRSGTYRYGNTIAGRGGDVRGEGRPARAHGNNLNRHRSLVRRAMDEPATLNEYSEKGTEAHQTAQRGGSAEIIWILFFVSMPMFDKQMMRRRCYQN